MTSCSRSDGGCILVYRSLCAMLFRRLLFLLWCSFRMVLHQKWSRAIFTTVCSWLHAVFVSVDYFTRTLSTRRRSRNDVSEADRQCCRVPERCPVIRHVGHVRRAAVGGGYVCERSRFSSFTARGVACATPGRVTASMLVADGHRRNNISTVGPLHGHS